MKATKGNDDATHRLVDLSVHEVSLVTAAANKRQFLVVKADGMRGKQLKAKSSATEIAAVVAELQKLDASTPDGLKTLREKTAMLAELIKEDEGTPADPATPAVDSTPEPATAPVAAASDTAVSKESSLDSLLVTKASNAPTDTSMQQVASALEALTQVVKMQSTAGSPTSNVAKDEHLSEEKTSDPWSEFDRKSSL